MKHYQVIYLKIYSFLFKNASLRTISLKIHVRFNIILKRPILYRIFKNKFCYNMYYPINFLSMKTDGFLVWRTIKFKHNRVGIRIVVNMFVFYDVLRLIPFFNSEYFQNAILQIRYWIACVIRCIFNDIVISIGTTIGIKRYVLIVLYFLVSS